jgi:hypothetical protein
LFKHKIKRINKYCVLHFGQFVSKVSLHQHSLKMSLIVVGVVISFLTLSSYLGNAASENIHVSTKTAKVFKDFSLHEEIDQIVDRVASRMIESIKKIENRESLELLPGITLEK